MTGSKGRGQGRSSQLAPPSPSERDIQAAILTWLWLHHIPAWRANTGAMAGSYKGRSRFIRFGPKGQSDILGVLPGSGRFLCIEVKRPGRSLTEDQQAFFHMVTTAGGVAILAHALADIEFLDRLT